MKKFLPYILIILIALVGFFVMVEKTRAADPLGTCTDIPITPTPSSGPTTKTELNTTEGWCSGMKGKWTQNKQGGTGSGNCTVTDQNSNVFFTEDGYKTEECSYAYLNARAPSAGFKPQPPFHYNWKSTPGAPPTATTTPAPDKSEFDKWANDESCGKILDSSVAGCTKALFYYVFYVPSAAILKIAAKFFDALVFIALDSKMISGSAFVMTAWTVVRDLSNIFFILILLYVAIKLILDIGSADAKKTIARVVIIALLINFSMFFTQVVVDTSNVLALVFYNKLDVTYEDASGNTVNRPDDPVNSGEKGLSGSMYKAFDPTSQLGAPFWGPIQLANGGKIPVGTMIAVILIATAIMLFAAYAFFVSGIAFLARLIELWVLIIFSPFAFMSLTLSEMAGVDYIGWNQWFARLRKTAFMAPIFMFFMYLIFLMLKPPGLFAGLQPNPGVDHWSKVLLLLLIPAMVILVLLLKATEFAKKGAGAIGEKLMSGAKTVGGMVGGFALGAATGGAALALTNTMGRKARETMNNDDLKKQALGDKDHFARLGINDVNVQKKMQATAQKKLARANEYASKSFDVRDTGIGKFVAKKTGMDFNKGTGIIGVETEKLKGGRNEQAKRLEKKEEEKKKQYLLSTADAQKQDEYAKIKYVEEKAKAKEDAENTGQGFDEKAFEKAYTEKGIILGYGRDDRRVDKNNYNSKKINEEREKAYNICLEDRGKKETEKGFLKKWGEGNKKMITTAGGLGTVVTVGALTGGAIAFSTIFAGGLAHAIKETVMPSINLSDAVVRGNIKKEESKEKKFLDLAKKLVEDKEKDSDKTKTPATPTPAGPTPPPASPPPAPTP